MNDSDTNAKSSLIWCLHAKYLACKNAQAKIGHFWCNTLSVC